LDTFSIHITLVEFETHIGVQVGKLVKVDEDDKTLLVFQDGGEQTWVSFEQVLSFELESYDLHPTGKPKHYLN